MRKSVSVETSYDPDLGDLGEIELALGQVAIDLHQRLEKVGIAGRMLTLKLKFADYSQVTRSITHTITSTEVRSIQESSKRLLDGLDLEKKSIRLFDLGIGKLIAEDGEFQQLVLKI